MILGELPVGIACTLCRGCWLDCYPGV